MTYERLKEYLYYCHKYGWKPTLFGLKMFHYQVKMGFREIAYDDVIYR